MPAHSHHGCSLLTPSLMDDKLIKALDRVLTLSGGDLEGGTFKFARFHPLHTETKFSVATEALKERCVHPYPQHLTRPLTAHRIASRRRKRGTSSLATPSSSCSTVSSPTLTESLLESPLPPLTFHPTAAASNVNTNRPYLTPVRTQQPRNERISGSSPM